MIVKRTVQEDDTGKLIECIIDSSNILKSGYFAHNKNLYIYFKRGHVYAYQNVPENIYEEFEKSNSHGEYFRKVIAKDYLYLKLFKMTETELTETKDLILEWKEDNPQ